MQFENLNFKLHDFTCFKCIWEELDKKGYGRNYTIYNLYILNME